LRRVLAAAGSLEGSVVVGSLPIFTILDALQPGYMKTSDQ
jgi:hypothetical protein